MVDITSAMGREPINKVSLVFILFYSVILVMANGRIFFNSSIYALILFELGIYTKRNSLIS